jgi:hypothetical protein
MTSVSSMIEAHDKAAAEVSPVVYAVLQALRKLADGQSWIEGDVREWVEQGERLRSGQPATPPPTAAKQDAPAPLPEKPFAVQGATTLADLERAFLSRYAPQPAAPATPPPTAAVPQVDSSDNTLDGTGIPAPAAPVAPVAPPDPTDPDAPENAVYLEENALTLLQKMGAPAEQLAHAQAVRDKYAARLAAMRPPSVQAEIAAAEPLTTGDDDRPQAPPPVSPAADRMAKARAARAAKAAERKVAA